MRKILITFLIFIFTNADSSEIVKELNFDIRQSSENCGIANARYIFYSDSKYELVWSCPEKKEPDVYSGTWKNLSKNSDTLNHLSTIYAYNGVQYKDIIKINDNSINISWNGGEEIKYRYTVDKKDIVEKEDKKIVQQKNENTTSEQNQENDNKNVESVSVDSEIVKEVNTVKKITNDNPDDLTGNWLTCEGKNIIHDETLAIQFISKKKVRYAYVKYGLDAREPYIIILNKGEDLKYEVNDKYIVIKTKPMIDHTWGNGDKEKGFTLIDRDYLTINQNLLGQNHKYWKGMDIYPYPTKPQCYLVNAEKENPFEKFENINLKQEDKKEKKL